MQKQGMADKRLAFVFRSKLRDQKRIADAVCVQDALRGKSEEWNRAKEVRKWREAR